MLRPPSASALLQLLLQLLHQALETVRVLARCLMLCKVRAIRLSSPSLPRLPPPFPGKRCFIGNLAWRTSWQDLKDKFITNCQGSLSPARSQLLAAHILHAPDQAPIFP
jgi:hypothetical protein